jgi:hypothetical protein
MYLVSTNGYLSSDTVDPNDMCEAGHCSATATVMRMQVTKALIRALP